MGGQLVGSFSTPCYALKLIHSMCARASLLPPARASYCDRDETSSSSLPRCLAPPSVRSKESSAMLDRPSIRVDIFVYQIPHALHALCVLCGPLVSQGAPISKSVCDCFTQPWCGRLVVVC